MMPDLLGQYTVTRNRSTELCAPLHIEDFIPQAVEFTSPPKWHLAHTSWFFEEMILSKYMRDYRIFDEAYNSLFNSYYNHVGEIFPRDQRGMMTRPGVDEVYQYRKHVDEAISKLLSASYPDEVRELLILGINHEHQHQELLLTDLKYTLALNPTFPVYEAGGNLVNDENETTGWLNISQDIYEIGHYSNDFAFDNESGRHKVFLHDFEISKSLITNGEFIEFMADGGYRNFQHWLDDGWSWVNEENITKPLYWFNKDGKWFYFTLAGLQPINTNAILSHVSYYEAAAFAAWKGHRLPTEFEWEVASSQLNWGKRWEWTGSAYLPYPGFKIATGAVGEYNGKFMINQMVLRGASVATATGHSRNTYRNFFQPQSQWQFSGIRLAR
jgi:ergothioneine biosynthesis protein EgtB